MSSPSPHALNGAPEDVRLPENPLLPNDRLRSLHALLSQSVAENGASQRSRRSGSKIADAPESQPGTLLRHREALLAATLLQLCPGDILVAEPQDTLAHTILRFTMAATGASLSLLELAHGSPQLALALGMSQVLQRTGNGSLVFTLLQSGYNEPEWAHALTLAQETQLPLILACAEPGGADSFRTDRQTTRGAPLNWTSVQRLASRSGLPILSVDGEDAVAVYRVMQESVLRARSGGGPAVLWAMLPTPAEAASRPRTLLPLARLERYLQARQIAL